MLSSYQPKSRSHYFGSVKTFYNCPHLAVASRPLKCAYNLENTILTPFKSVKNISLDALQTINNRISRFRCSGVPPKALTFAITHLCNSRCAMCNIWKIYQNNPNLITKELSLSEIREFFSDRDFFKYLSFIQLTGGEPFLRDDLVEIVQCIHERRTDCLIYVATNGFLSDRIALVTREIMTFHKNFSLGISLDGINDTHDKIRGVNNSFEKACKTLSLLRKDFPDLPLQVTMTVSAKNLKDIPKVYEFAKKNNYRFRVALANRAVFYQNIENECTFSKVHIKKLKAYFSTIKKDIIREKGRVKSVPERFWLDGNIKFAINPKKHILPCYSGFTQFFLDPHGIVYPCLVFSENIGNIREKNIRKLWFSERAKAIREQIKKNKCPNCWLAHEAIPSIYNNFFGMFKYLWKS